ncbi:DUF5309 domain-containing protein [Agrobacterium tumefaciens]|uniref:DUF5309 domain-containing protein n=1 Tax=Agrobacterium tumefaciens TaxID=358 RepID=A0AAJ4TBX3_AGRTU|nr:DUF5309 domain-containing protein [Agrobacterium tumefaciens]
MAVLITNEVASVREDLSNLISQISPTDRPFTTSIGTATAKQPIHDFLNDVLAPANADNAHFEGADAPNAVMEGPKKIQNICQIFSKTAFGSNTLTASDTAGAKNELARQIVNKTKEVLRDKEAAYLSGNGSSLDPAAPRKTAGAVAWIKTNVSSGVGGSTPGYANGIVAPVVAGTTRTLTEDMFLEAAEKAWNEGGKPTKVFAPGTLKRAISRFSGDATKFQDMNKTMTTYQGVSIYESDFGRFDIIPAHFAVKTSVLLIDPSLWADATLRGLEKIKLGVTGDNEKYQIVSESTLVSRNEAGNAAINDVTE